MVDSIVFQVDDTSYEIIYYLSIESDRLRQSGPRAPSRKCWSWRSEAAPLSWLRVLLVDAGRLEEAERATRQALIGYKRHVVLLAQPRPVSN